MAHRQVMLSKRKEGITFLCVASVIYYWGPGPRATAGLALRWASAVVYRRSFIVMLYLHLQVILTVAGETPVHQRVLLVVLWSCCHRAPYTRQTETTDYFIKNGIHKNQKTRKIKQKYTDLIFLLILRKGLSFWYFGWQYNFCILVSLCGRTFFLCHTWTMKS